MISLDIETSCNGSAEYRYWRPGFQIDSMAMSWRTEDGAIKSWFSNKSDEIRRVIHQLAASGKPLLVHNLSFELGVFLKLYPDLKFNWAADSMRMAQLHDNAGGNKFEKFEVKTVDDLMDEILAEDGGTGSRKSGMGLEACASRYLPLINQNHKSVAHRWLEENAGVKANHGQHLHLLPYDQLKQYNIADTETTLLLYETLAETLTMEGFDWSSDWVLYQNRVRLMAKAYIRGLKIDRERLKREIYRVDAEVKEVMSEFFNATVEARADWARKFPGKIKSRPTSADAFNIGSNTQLKQLFIDCLGVVGGRTTKTGLDKIEAKQLTSSQAALQYPSFASKHLSTWGPLGEVLYKRRRLLLVLQQMLGVYLGSAETGRLHPEIRASGTSSNRVAGGKGVE